MFFHLDSFAETVSEKKLKNKKAISNFMCASGPQAITRTNCLGEENLLRFNHPNRYSDAPPRQVPGKHPLYE
jgi:hypothetical protein